MNCLEFRRQVLVDPRTHTESMRGHQHACEACANFANRQMATERQLQSALHIAPPEGLNSRILLRQQMSEQPRPRWKQPLWLSLAATLVLSLSLVAGVLLSGSNNGLQHTVLAHVNNELYHLEDRYNLPLPNVNKVLQPHGARLTASPWTVNYAGSCAIRKHEGAHVVIQTDTGPVTVLLMPGEHIDRRQTLADERFHGVILPTANGSLAIVGENKNALQNVERQMRHVLQVNADPA